MEPQRPYCRQYVLEKHCRFGEQCRFLHATLPPDVCKFYAVSGHCSAGETCRFLHQRPSPPLTASLRPVEEPKGKSSLPVSREDGKKSEPATRTPFIKQGLKPEEKAAFERNKQEWAKFPTYSEYLKSLKDDNEKDVAQVLRKYQYSFVRDPGTAMSFSIHHTYFCAPTRSL